MFTAKTTANLITRAIWHVAFWTLFCAPKDVVASNAHTFYLCGSSTCAWQEMLATGFDESQASRSRFAIMAFTAKPYDLQGLRIIGMMCLNVYRGIAARACCRSNPFSTFNQLPNNAASIFLRGKAAAAKRGTIKPSHRCFAHIRRCTPNILAACYARIKFAANRHWHENRLVEITTEARQKWAGLATFWWPSSRS